MNVGEPLTVALYKGAFQGGPGQDPITIRCSDYSGLTVNPYIGRTWPPPIFRPHLLEPAPGHPLGNARLVPILLEGYNSIKEKVIEEYRGPLLTSGTDSAHDCEHFEA